MTFNLHRAPIEKYFLFQNLKISHFLIQNLSLLQCYNDIYYITVCNNKPAEFTVYDSSHDKGLMQI